MRALITILRWIDMMAPALITLGVVVLALTAAMFLKVVDLFSPRASAGGSPDADAYDREGGKDGA